MIKNPREAAYLALLGSERGNAFITDSLDKWQLENSPPKADVQFARQIAYGTCQMAHALGSASNVRTRIS